PFERARRRSRTLGEPRALATARVVHRDADERPLPRQVICDLEARRAEHPPPHPRRELDAGARRRYQERVGPERRSALDSPQSPAEVPIASTSRRSRLYPVGPPPA